MRRAVEQRHLAVLAAALERALDDRPQRREADPAGDDDHVASRRVVDRPRVPNGPRTPSTAPGLATRRSPAVTAPTARTVCTSGPRRRPLTEIGTSPTPKA